MDRHAQQLEELLSEGNVELARQLATQRLTTNPRDTASRCTLAKLELLDLDVGAARIQLDQVEDRSATQVTLVRAGVAALDGDDEAARASFTAVLAAEPDRVEALLGLGLSLARLGDLPGALTALERSVAAAPDSAACHYHLGRCQLELDRTMEAMESVGRSITLDPLYPDAYVVLARASAIAGQVAAGIDLLDQGLTLMPGQAQLLAELTNLKLLAGDVDGSHDVALQLATAAPTDAVAQANLAAHLLAAGRLDDVIELCTWVAEQGQLTAQVALVLAMAYEAQEDLDAAIATYGQAMELDSTDWRAANNLGLLLLRNGGEELVHQAIAVLTEANRRAPQQLEPVLNLALACTRGGRTAEALALSKYITSFGLHPEHPVRRQAQALTEVLSG